MRTANIALFVVGVFAFFWMINSRQQPNTTIVTDGQRATRTVADSAEQSLATTRDTSPPE